MKKKAEIIYDSLLITILFSLVFFSFIYALQIRPKEYTASDTVLGIQHKSGYPIVEKKTTNNNIQIKSDINDLNGEFDINIKDALNVFLIDICFILNEQNAVSTYDLRIEEYLNPGYYIFSVIINGIEYPLYNNENKMNYLIRIKPDNVADLSIKAVKLEDKAIDNVKLKVFLQRIDN